MATAPELQEPQIAAARAQAWHQQADDALITLEGARAWLNQYGLVPFAPRGGSLGAPAPSLVEATLGTAKATVTLAETETARGLLARLTGEGSALPLNLLGGPGDLPDFVVSAQVFPFVFTLRGDKGWKRPPETAGAVKVTPLGLRVYELLAEKGPMTVAEIVPEAGREVTESAIARALGELWQILRVIPVLHQGDGETRWELTMARFLKAVKAGANAGQPTALSALASLYLAQAFVATEEEIAGFLSPLTARSRVRDVLHGLTAGRQLAEGVLHGKTVLYLPEALPDLARFAPTEDGDVQDGDVQDVEASGDAADDESGQGEAVAGDQVADGQEETAGEAASERPRSGVRRFEGGTSPGGRTLRGKPLRRDGAAPQRPGSAEGPGQGGFRGPRPDRGAPQSGDRRPYAPRGERPARRELGGDRPFRDNRAGQSRPERPSFARPWDEESGARPPRQDGGERRPYRDSGESRPPRPARDGGGDAPVRRREFSGKGPDRDRGGFQGRGAGDADRPQRPYRPRAEGEGRPFRPQNDERPGQGRPFRPRPDGARPYTPRAEGSGDRPYRPRTEGGGGRPFRPRSEGGGDRPYRPRPEGDAARPFRPRGEEGGDRPFRPRRDEGEKRPFRPREGGGPERGGFRDRRGPGGPPAGRFGSNRPPRSADSEGRRPEGANRRPPFGGRSAQGGPPREGRAPGGFGDRRAPRPGGSRPGFKKPGSRFPDRKGPSDRPERPVRKPRPEDEA